MNPRLPTVPVPLTDDEPVSVRDRQPLSDLITGWSVGAVLGLGWTGMVLFIMASPGRRHRRPLISGDTAMKWYAGLVSLWLLLLGLRLLGECVRRSARPRLTALAITLATLVVVWGALRLA